MRTRSALHGLVGAAAAATLAALTLPASSADTKAGCVAASDQGQQLRDDGKYQRAREQFQSCSRDACPKVVSHLCAQWLHEIDETMPTLVIGAKDEHGADIADARVSIDGTPLLERLDGKPVAVDPGEHVLRVERAGLPPVEQRLVVRVGEKTRPVIVTLTGALASAPPQPEASASSGSQPEAIAARPSSSAARTATVVAFGVLAVGAIAGGVYFGVQSNSHADSAAQLRSSLPPSGCAHGGSQACQDLSDAVDTQNRDATFNKVFFVAGGVFAAGAVVTWLLWKKDEPKKVDAAHVWLAPSLGAGGGGVRVGGSF